MVLFSYMGGRGKTLAEVAREFELEESQLEPYNKWIRRNRIPGDKDYPLIIPDYSGRRPEPLLARTGYPQPPRRVIEQTSREATRTDTNFATVENTDAFPRIEQARRWGRAVTLVNRVRATLLRGGEDIKDISERTGVAPSRLVKFNDLTSEDAQLREGDPFYLRNKRNKAPAHYHAVLPGETLWSISQRFGIKLDKLLRNNRMRQEEKLRPGRVLWLRFIRPPHIPVEYRSVPGQKERPPAGPAEKAVSSRQKSVKQEQEQPGRTVKPVASARPGTVSAASEQARRPAAEKEPDPVNESTARPKAKKERGTEKPLIPVVDEKNTIRERYHVVKAGETLYSIARRYDLTVPQLTSYNDLSYEADLAIGQRLRLSPPENSTPPATAGDSGNSPEISFTEHEVQPGETMYRIARQYEVSIKELMEWNEKEDFNVSVGEKLKVKRP
jgi:membrane-bound lytic murein transglycosylase D